MKEKVESSVFYGGYHRERLPDDGTGSKTGFSVPTTMCGEWFCGTMMERRFCIDHDLVQGPFSSYEEAAALVREEIGKRPYRYDPNGNNMFICIYPSKI